MAEVTSTRYGVKYGYGDGEAGWGANINYMLQSYDVYVATYLLSLTITAPPTGATESDAYYCPPQSLGAWSGKDGKIAVWQKGAWAFYQVPRGLRAFVVDIAAFRFFKSNAWVAETTAASGTVVSVNGVTPDANGLVELVAADLPDLMPTSGGTFTAAVHGVTPATNSNDKTLVTSEWVRAVFPDSAGGGGSGTTLTVSDTAPTSPAIGAGWFSALSGALAIWTGTGWAGIYASPSTVPAYTLHPATTTVLGGVKADGSTITVAGDGTISSVPPAGWASTTQVAAAVQTETTRAEATETYLGSIIQAETGRAEGVEATLAPKNNPAFIAPLTIEDDGTNDTAAVTVSAVADGNGVNIKLIGNGTTTPSKVLRVANGAFSVINDAYNNEILTLRDTGDLTIKGELQSTDLNIAGTGNIAGAWTEVDGTPVCATGSFTSCSYKLRYVKLGRTVFVSLVISIPQNGTAGGFIAMLLPFTAGPAGAALNGRETAVNGIGCCGAAAPNSNVVSVQNYSGGYPGVDGAVIVLSGTFEATA